MRPRILFLAGESEGGRRSVVGGIHIYSALVHADIILRQAGPSYFSGEHGDFDDWSLWVSELENPEHRDRHYAAVLKSMVKAIKLARERLRGDVVIQGAIVGHPAFRVLMRDLLEREFSAHFRDANVAMFWLDLPLQEVLDKAKVCNPNVTMREIEERVSRYRRLMSAQSFRRFDSKSACIAAATSFLLDESEED